MDINWNYDVANAPSDGTRILVAWKDDSGNKGTCEAKKESAFGFGEATDPSWRTMSGDADGLGDVAVPGTVYAWSPKPDAPNPAP